MRRLFLIAFALMLLTGACHAEKNSNWHWVSEYAGKNVGEKTVAAQDACYGSLPCIIVFDADLAGFATGTLPSRCANCLWLDYRTPGQVISNGGGGAGGGSVTSVGLVTTPSDFRVINSPITSAGNLTLDWSLTLAPNVNNAFGTIVRRSALDGSFSAGTITANGFVGNLTGVATQATLAASAGHPANTPVLCTGTGEFAKGVDTNFDAANCATPSVTTVTGTLGRGHGGTGHTVYTDGQILIGNSSTGDLDQSSITAGTGITVTNGNGTVTIAATGGGSAQARGVPTTITDLVFWYAADQMTTYYGNGSQVPRIPELSMGVFPIANDRNGGTFNTNAINGLPSITLPGGTASSNRYWLPEQGGNSTSNAPQIAGVVLSQMTFFIVMKPQTDFSIPRDIMSGLFSNSMEVYIDTTGKLTLNQQNTALIGAATTAFTLNSWSQSNATYNSTSGAYAFRLNRAANGSGTNSLAISGPDNAFFFRAQTVGGDFSGEVAEVLVYDRVLTGGEITTIETYLNGKYAL